MTTVTCNYCGVSYPASQSRCDGCAGNLPPVETSDPPATKRRQVVAAALGVAVLLTAVLVISNRLSGPRQVEIVGAAGEVIGAVSPGTQPPKFEPGSMESRYLMNANFAGAYATVSPLRMVLVQFRQMEGHYPAAFSDVGVDDAQLSDGRFVSSVTLREGGVMIAGLEPAVFGDGALLELRPVDVMSGMQTRWDCRTTVPDEARVDIPGNLQCPYDSSLTL